MRIRQSLSVILTVFSYYMAFASDTLTAVSSQTEADRSFAAYTNNELKIVSTAIEEWDAVNPYKVVDRLPANLTCHLAVARVGDAHVAEAAIETVKTSMPAHVRAYFTQYKVMGPFLNWILRRCKPGVVDEKSYLVSRVHRAVWSADEFDLPKLAQVAHDVTSNSVPLVTALQPVYGEFARFPTRKAAPLVDYPDPRPEQTFVTPCGIGVVLRAVENRRKFRFAAYAGRPDDTKVNFKWVVMSTSGATFGVTVTAMNGQWREFSPEKGYGEIVLDWMRLGARVDVAVFARHGVGPYGPPSIISFYKVPNERRTYDREGRIDRIEYAKSDFLIPELFQNKQWTDDYVIDDIGHVIGFVRKRYNQAINPERFSNEGEYVVEAYPSGLPKTSRRVRYFASPADPAILDYEITTASVDHPMQTFVPRDRGEFPTVRKRR